MNDGTKTRKTIAPALKAERDALADEVSALRTCLGMERDEVARLTEDRDQTRRLLADSFREEIAGAAARFALVEERDALKAERDQIQRILAESFRDATALREKRDALEEERDALMEERDALENEREALVEIRNTLDSRIRTAQEEIRDTLGRL